MKKKVLAIALLSLLSLVSCESRTVSDIESNNTDTLSTSETTDTTTEISNESSEDSTASPLLNVKDISLGVYESKTVTPVFTNTPEEDFTMSTDSEYIRIEDKNIVGLYGNTEASVTVTTKDSKMTTTFKVKVNSSTYTSKHVDAETSEGWFNDVSVDKIDSMKADFANGMDISSYKQIKDNGQKFYDRDGNEASLFLLLKEAGLNWVRFRLWNEPYDIYTDANGDEQKFQYGGGNNDCETLEWLSKEAKSVGLKVFLDFHYSDFWCDPGSQIIPKMWSKITTSDEMAAALKSYTKTVLNDLKKVDALPDMVSIGNEIISGMLVHTSSGSQTAATGNDVEYSLQKTSAPSAVRGSYSGDSANLKKYLKAGIEAVNEVDSSILKMVHIAKSVSTAGLPQINNFYNNICGDLDYDVIGLSAYSYYHMSSINDFKNTLKTLSTNFPTKQICIAETSYGFTYETDTWAANIYNASGTACPKFGYETSIQGQASILRDTTEAVASISNGFGVFYWEGAWTPTKKSGWTDYLSRASWANQALFSYNGKALGSLDVYKQMKGE